MLLALIAKDLSRVRRNPLPWIINLLVPLCMVALIGAVFGGGDKDRELATIHFAVVDEDHSRLVELFRGSLNQGRAAKQLDPEFLDREPALAKLNANKLSAVLILPKDFSADFLSGRPAHLELIKNPAQSIQPAVLDELLGILTTGLNAVSRNLADELPAVSALLKGDPDYRQIAQLVMRVGDRIESVRKLQAFPLASYATETRPGTTAAKGPGFSLFGYLLAGMAGMFLLFLANTGMSDLHREVQQRTLERYATHHVTFTPFILGKVLFVMVMLVLCAAVLFIGGGIAFRIDWQHPGQMAVLVLSYALFGAGLMAFLVAMIPDQRRSDSVVTMINMGLAIAGGCAFPPQQLPPFVRDHLTPFLPTSWFTESVRTLEFAAGSTPWGPAAVRLSLIGLVLMVSAAFLLRRRFSKGLRA